MHTDLDTLATALYVTIDDTLKTTPELRRWRPAMGVRLLRPAFANEPSRPGGRLLGTIRQLIESVNDTRKGQLDLERYGGRTIEGVMVRSCSGCWP